MFLTKLSIYCNSSVRFQVGDSASTKVCHQPHDTFSGWYASTGTLQGTFLSVESPRPSCKSKLKFQKRSRKAFFLNVLNGQSRYNHLTIFVPPPAEYLAFICSSFVILVRPPESTKDHFLQMGKLPCRYSCPFPFSIFTVFFLASPCSSFSGLLLGIKPQDSRSRRVMAPNIFPSLLLNSMKELDEKIYSQLIISTAYD